MAFTRESSCHAVCKLFLTILRLPDNCTFEHGALAEPLSVLIHASRRADLAPGQTVLVFGVGTIGMLACALAKSIGATHIVAIDKDQTRLDFAKSNGFASKTFCVPSADRAKTTDEQLRRAKEQIQNALAEFNEKDGFDVVFECTGAESCIQMAVHVRYYALLPIRPTADTITPFRQLSLGER
jgi:L-iditol 2-dehydrogenase